MVNYIGLTTGYIYQVTDHDLTLDWGSGEASSHVVARLAYPLGAGPTSFGLGGGVLNQAPLNTVAPNAGPIGS